MGNWATLRWAFLVIQAVTCMVQVAFAGGEGSLRPEQCGSACDYRCSATHNKDACLKYCCICCKKCLCVPSGTYGNKDECPCYRDWMSSKGTPKCP